AENPAELVVFVAADGADRGRHSDVAGAASVPLVGLIQRPADVRNCDCARVGGGVRLAKLPRGRCRRAIAVCRGIAGQRVEASGGQDRRSAWENENGARSQLSLPTAVVRGYRTARYRQDDGSRQFL